MKKILMLFVLVFGFVANSTDSTITKEQADAITKVLSSQSNPGGQGPSQYYDCLATSTDAQKDSTGQILPARTLYCQNTFYPNGVTKTNDNSSIPACKEAYKEYKSDIEAGSKDKPSKLSDANDKLNDLNQKLADKKGQLSTIDTDLESQITELNGALSKVTLAKNSELSKSQDQITQLTQQLTDDKGAAATTITSHYTQDINNLNNSCKADAQACAMTLMAAMRQANADQNSGKAVANGVAAGFGVSSDLTYIRNQAVNMGNPLCVDPNSKKQFIGYNNCISQGKKDIDNQRKIAVQKLASEENAIEAKITNALSLAQAGATANDQEYLKIEQQILTAQKVAANKKAQLTSEIQMLMDQIQKQNSLIATMGADNTASDSDKSDAAEACCVCASKPKTTDSSSSSPSSSGDTCKNMVPIPDPTDGGHSYKPMNGFCRTMGMKKGTVKSNDTTK